MKKSTPENLWDNREQRIKEEAAKTVLSKLHEDIKISKVSEKPLEKGYPRLPEQIEESRQLRENLRIALGLTNHPEGTRQLWQDKILGLLSPNYQEAFKETFKAICDACSKLGVKLESM